MSAIALRTRKFCMTRALSAEADERFDEAAAYYRIIDFLDKEIEEAAEKQFTRPIGTGLSVMPPDPDKAGYPW